MSFYKKYELIDVLRDDGVKTFQAKEIETGRAVEVHLIVGIPGQSDPPYSVLEGIRSIPADRRAHLIETGEHMGTPYVVTLPLAGFANLRDWVQANKVDPLQGESLTRVGRWKIPASLREAAASSEPAPPTKRQSVPQPEVPDITRMFKTAEIVVPPKENVAPAASTARADDFDSLFGSGGSTASRPAPASAPGEFTSMFQTGGSAGSTPAPHLPSPPPPSSSPVARSDDHDDFNRMFDTATGRIKPTDLPKTPPASEPAKSAPGEFTSMFQTPAAAPPKTERPKVEAPRNPAVTPPASAPGEFTQMFQATQAPAKAPPVPSFPPPSPPVTPPSSAPGEFTQMFQTGQAKVPTGPQTPPASPPAKSGAPGEFTQMFHAQGPAKATDLSKTAQGPAFTPPGPASKTAAPGEFTQMFHAPTGAAPVPEASRTAQRPAFTPPAPAEPAKPSVTGEFGQMFQTGPIKQSDVPLFGQTGGFPATPPPAVPGPAGPSSAPGEFTQMFHTGQQKSAEPPAKPITQKGTPPGMNAPPAPPQGPGEFTRMFSSPLAQPLGEPASTAMPSTPATPPGAPPREAGEFTRMFSPPGANIGALPKQTVPFAQPQQSPLSQPNPFAPPTSPLAQPMLPPNPGNSSPFAQPASPFGATPPGPASSPFGPPPSSSPFGQSAPPSSFGQQSPPSAFGQAPASPLSQNPSAGQTFPTLPPHQPFSAPQKAPSVQDEYAKLFGGGSAAPAPGGFSPSVPAAPPQPAGFTGATQSFQAPRIPSAPAQPSGPSEYTRMFHAPVDAAAAPVPPPQVQAPIPLAAAKKFPKWPIFVAGGVLLLLIIGLIVTLVRK